MYTLIAYRNSSTFTQQFFHYREYKEKMDWLVSNGFTIVTTPHASEFLKAH